MFILWESLCKRQYDSMSKHKKMLLFILLSWLSNELLQSINKLKRGLWCIIWLSYVYIYGNHWDI